MEKESDEQLSYLIENFGGWPVVEGDQWSKLTFDWVEATIRMRNLGYGFSQFISINVMTDFKNNTRHIIGVKYDHS